ncbi:MAG: hypothetical protein F3743_01050 [Nitrospinae bacterium]|nr:hypothetical protein [Nitrospinota bacterium]
MSFILNLVGKSVDFDFQSFPDSESEKKVGCVMSDVDKEKKSSDSPEQKEEPGLMESYGSFPVWSLKLIDAITPEFLISKEPVEKKKLPQ